MDRGLTRRQVIKGLGGMAAGTAVGVLPSASRADECALAGIAYREAVPNRGHPLAGIHAVAQKSIAAGDTVDFRVSSDRPYRIKVTRLGWGTDLPGGDWDIEDLGAFGPSVQTVHPGSYVHVERSLPSVPTRELSLECWVRHFGAGWQGLVTQYDYGVTAGVGLFVDDAGRPVCYFGDGGAFQRRWLVAGATPLVRGSWHHVVATFRDGVTRLYVDGLKVSEVGGMPWRTQAGDCPMRLGAYGSSGETVGFLTGDLGMPVVYARALTGWEIGGRAKLTPPTAPTGCDVVGCWPLDEEGSAGPDVRDVSGIGRDGLIVNRGTWMIGGPGFDARRVGRFDTSYVPSLDATRGHSLRLSPDDLYEVDWPTRHRVQIPADLPSGLYVGRIEHASGERYDQTFVVRSAASRPKARILVLCATNTWHAYNDHPFVNGMTSAGDYSFYQPHAHGGLPGYQIGMDLPWPSADPYEPYQPSWYSHLVRAERFLHVWLERNGYDYDLASDADLDADPSLLDDHAVVFVAGHSEYWSRSAYDALQAYLSSGGQVVSISGNTMFWRVTMEDGVLECRKLPDSVGGSSGDLVGELYHTHDQQRGGLAREAGMPAWQALGLECVGYGGAPVPYLVRDDSHPFYHEPEEVGLSRNDRLGPLNTVFHEYDVTLSQIAGAPLAPADYSPRVLAQGVQTGPTFDYQASPGWNGSTSRSVVSEVIDWQRLEGGRVFAAGSINVGQALHGDRALGSLFRNALDQMGVVFRLTALARSTNDRLQTRWFDGRSWGPTGSPLWADLGTGIAGPPVGVMWAPNKLAIMAVSTHGSLLYRHWTGSAWSSWSDFGGRFQGRPAAVAWGRNRLEIFCRGQDDHLYQKSWTGTRWTGWRSLGADACSSPSAIVWEGDQLAVAVLGPRGNVQYKWWTADRDWSPSGSWQDMGGTSFVHPPALVAWNSNQINVFAVDAAGRVHTKWWDGSSWSPSITSWQSLGGEIGSALAVGIREGKELSLFGVGRDGHLKLKWWNGARWEPVTSDWQDLGGQLIGSPAVASYRGRHLSVVATGASGTLQHLFWDGHQWSGWESMGGSLRPDPAIFSWIAGSP